jgi:sugar (pentulose or hexulose) kinase
LDCFLGIDLGTSGCRGVAIDTEGEVVAETSVRLPPSCSERDGESRQQPGHWWHAVVEILSQLGRNCRHHTIRAIAVDGTSSTLLLCDGAGHPLTPALMYDDRCGQESLHELRMAAPAESPVLSATSSLAKLLYLRRNLGLDRFLALHQADWIMGKLCGCFGLSDQNNCLKLGYDLSEGAWPAWLDSLDLPQGCLPQVHPVGSLVGHLSRSAADATGLKRDIAIVTGTTDSNAAFLATGADSIGDAVTSLGSTLVLKILSDRPVFAADYGVYSHRLDDQWLVSGASNSGGAVCRAFFTDREIETLTRQMRPDRPTGLDYYPLLRPGERFPINDSELPPRLEPRPKEKRRFFQAILEGVTGIEREGYHLLQRLGAPRPSRIFSVGGGAVNEPWRVMRESALGVPVVRADHQEAAYGTALLARRGLLS